MKLNKLLIGTVLVVTLIVAAVFIQKHHRVNPQNVPKDTVVFALENEVATLDPVQIGDIFAFRVSAQAFEGLLELDDHGVVQPCVAERWTNNADFTTWKFTIRRGVKFHAVASVGFASREVTASDVAFSLQRSMLAASAANFVLAGSVKGAADFQAGKTPTVSGLRVIDDRTIEIDLAKPEASFLHRLTNPYLAVFPREVVGKAGDNFGKTVVSGTGPYRVDTIGVTEITLSKNPDYWRKLGAAAPKKLVFRIIKNDSVRLLEMQNGRIDCMRLVPALVNANVERNGSVLTLKGSLASAFTLSRVPTFSSYFVALNTERLKPELRKAMSLGVNRNEALNVVVNGIGRIRVGTVPEGCGGYRSPLSEDIFNLAAAKEAFAKAGSNGTNKIELLVHEQDSTDVLGELLQNQLSAVGIKLEVKKLEFNTAIQRMIDGNFDAIALSFQYVYSDPEPILRSCYHSSNIPAPNFWRLRSDEIDSMLDQLSSQSDANGLAFAAKIEQRVNEEAPAVFLYEMDNLFITKSLVLSGLHFTRLGVPLFWKVGGT